MMPVVMASFWLTDLACQRILHCSVQRAQDFGALESCRLSSTQDLVMVAKLD